MTTMAATSSISIFSTTGCDSTNCTHSSCRAWSHLLGPFSKDHTNFDLPALKGFWFSLIEPLPLVVGQSPFGKPRPFDLPSFLGSLPLHGTFRSHNKLISRRALEDLLNASCGMFAYQSASFSLPSFCFSIVFVFC